MVDFGFLLFYIFLIAFSFPDFLFRNMQNWILNDKILFSSYFPFVASFKKPVISTLGGKILNSFFFNVIFLLKCAFKQLQEWILDG